ncbi:hypothetical protein BGZ83_011904 [Gryganskiella cystojenkinii]|nr:hypothetical protein BGZ83_011904 [Gryganskiella cystojenkinii]
MAYSKKQHIQNLLSTPMSSTSCKTSTPVLISGAGPTGLFAAILLTKLNIPCRLIERHLEVSPLSKALVVHARTMEFMAMSGIIDRFLTEGHHLREFNVYQGGKLAAVFPVLNNQESHFNFGLFLEQIRTTALLTAKLNELGVQIDRGWELMDTKVVEEGKNSWVETTIRRAKTGTNIRATESKVLGVIEQDAEEEGKEYETEVIRSEYLIATDGGKSVVRHKLNIGFPGRTLDNNIIIYDGHVDSDIPFESVTVINGENNRIIFALPLHDGLIRIVLDNGVLTPEEHEALNPEELTLEKFTELAQACLGPNHRFKPKDCTWLTYYRVNERHAEHFSYKGRVFLAGDAAHVHSPAGGQGMNTGLQDSYNIAWKLALVLHGLAPKSLLETYEDERKPVAEGIIKLSGTMLENGLAKDFVRRMFKRIMITVGPYLFPYLAPSTNPVSMLTIRYHDNYLNQRNKSQPEIEEDFQVGQRARDGDLLVIHHKSDTAGLSVASEENVVRVHELTTGPGIFHILVFTSDMLVSASKPVPATIKGIETTNSQDLAGNIEHNLTRWRSKWFYKTMNEIIADTHSSVPASATNLSQASGVHAVASTASKYAIPCPTKADKLFMIHVLTTEEMNDQTVKVEKLVENKPGEGKIYLDRSGVVHQKYGIAAKQGAGTIVVVRPDGHIGYRTLGASHTAWEDVDRYLRTILA